MRTSGVAGSFISVDVLPAVGAADCAHPHETKIRIEIEKEMVDKYFRMLAPLKRLTDYFTIQIPSHFYNLAEYIRFLRGWVFIS